MTSRIGNTICKNCNHSVNQHYVWHRLTPSFATGELVISCEECSQEHAIECYVDWDGKSIMFKELFSHS